jgi:hypothetical protein
VALLGEFASRSDCSAVSEISAAGPVGVHRNNVKLAVEIVVVRRYAARAGAD